MKVLITGANGFLGVALLEKFLENQMTFEIVAAVRSNSYDFKISVNHVVVGDIDETNDWCEVLSNCEVIIHLAARVHVMQDAALDPLAEFRHVNVGGTLNLARQAAAAGVRRFVFVSSVKVNGEATQIGMPFRADGVSEPLDAYGVSKMEAEKGLRQIAASTGLEVVIIRPPLVYGPGVKANFASMMRCLKRGVPLPLGAINNKRSLVSLGNLVDLILTCVTHSAAANQTFMVSDGEDVSTTELLHRMGQAMGCPARLVPVPENLLRVAAGLIGRADMAQRLCNSLQVDISKTRELLGWTPPLTLDEGLAQAALGFK